MFNKIFLEIIIKRRVKQSNGGIYLYDYFKYLFFSELEENHLLTIWKSLSAPDKKVEKRTSYSIFPISCISKGMS